METTTSTTTKSPKAPSKAEQRQIDKAEALETLRRHVPKGGTIWAVLRHVSRSGMLRSLDFYTFDACEDGSIVKIRLTWACACALGYTYNTNRETLDVGGCGFDAADDVRGHLSRALFPTEDRPGYHVLVEYI